MKKVVLYFILALYGTLILPDQVFSLTASEIKQQMSDTNDQIEAINEEIQTLSKQITQNAQEKASLANTIKELNLTKTKLLKEKEEIQKKINVTNLSITSISSNIQNKEDSISLAKSSLTKLIRELNQNDNTLFLERFLSNENFSSFSNEYNNIISLNEDIQDKIGELEQEKVELSNSKQEKETEKQTLNNLKSDLVQKEQAVTATKNEKDTLLTVTKNKESAYQQMLAEKISKRDTFENALAEYEAQLQYTLNSSSLPAEGSEVLSWPLDYILITSLFGNRWGRMHGGVDFRASIGTSVKAVLSGTVIGTGDTDIDCKNASFGKWVLIKHDNGLSSVYAHLSVISVKIEQKVKTGQVVGLSGNTGYSTAPHLHLGVYASDGVKVDTVPSKSCSGAIFTQPIAATSAYLNPLLYLPKTATSMYKDGVL